jgi:hypothetical protein
MGKWFWWVSSGGIEARGVAGGCLGAWLGPRRGVKPLWQASAWGLTGAKTSIEARGMAGGRLGAWLGPRRGVKPFSREIEQRAPRAKYKYSGFLYTKYLGFLYNKMTNFDRLADPLPVCGRPPAFDRR